MASHDPRIIDLYGDESIVPQAAPAFVTEVGWSPPVVVPRSMVAVLAATALLAFGATDEFVAQPAQPTLDEVYKVQTYQPRQTIAIQVTYDDPVVVAQPVAFGLAEAEWQVPFSVQFPFALKVSQTQDERVEPPAPTPVDEVFWTPPYVVQPAKSLLVSLWQDELPPGIAFDEGVWVPPYSVGQALSLLVQSTQDERVEQIVLEPDRMRDGFTALEPSHTGATSSDPSHDGQTSVDPSHAGLVHA